MIRNKAFFPQPVVCLAGENYVICVPARTEVLLRLDVGGKLFYCDDNGVRKSGCSVHKFEVPVRLLDAECGYTVFHSAVRKRKPYFTELEEENKQFFSFSPVRDPESIHIAHLSDIHGLKSEGIRCGRFFGEALDLLILNGDVSSSSNSVEEILLPLDIAFEITKGERPCIISRGNHDLRGSLAERLGDYYPTCSGKTFYTVDLPGWSFVVLDCGEDKLDDNAEYGGTVAFHSFRLQETDFLRSIAGRKDEPFCSNRKIVLSHIPFMYRDQNVKFDIEGETYGEWCRILREQVHPAFGLFGHIHRMAYYPSGDPYDARGFGRPIILGGKPTNSPVRPNLEGAFITLHPDSAEVVFADAFGETSFDTVLQF